MVDNELSFDQTIELLNLLANDSLLLWDVPAGCEAQLINVSENVTYLIQAP